MPDLHQWIEGVWWRSSPPPLWLSGLSPIYGAISRIHLAHRAAHAQACELPLVSVGNLTAGGSGKTPFVIWLAGELKKRAYSPVILCRGDGGNAREPILVPPDALAAVVGDEALLLAQSSGCPVITGRDRIKGARMAAELGDIIILDDGFQYRQLARNCDIVLIPGEGIGNGKMIPAGPLRERPSSLARAHIIVRTGQPATSPLTSAREWHWQTTPAGLQDAMQSGAALPERVMAATGIARPDRFFKDLAKVGLNIAGTRSFPDHYRFGRADVAGLLEQPHPVAVTGKDAVKLIPLWPASRPLWVLPQRFDAEAGLIEAILDRIERGPD